MSPKSFEPVSFKRKVADPVKGFYRVYKDEKEFVRIEAETAAQAIEKSGVTGAVRVETEKRALMPEVKDAPAEEEKKPAAEPPKADAPPAEAAKPVEEKPAEEKPAAAENTAS